MVGLLNSVSSSRVNLIKAGVAFFCFTLLSIQISFAVTSTQITNYPSVAYQGQGEMYGGNLWFKSGDQILRYTGSGSISSQYTIPSTVSGVTVGTHINSSRVDIDSEGFMYFATNTSPNRIWTIDLGDLSAGPRLLFSGLNSSSCNAFVGGLIRVSSEMYFSCPDSYTNSNNKVYKFTIPAVGSPAKGTSDLTTVLNATTSTRVTDLDYRDQDGFIFAVQGAASSGQAAYISKFNPSSSLPVTPTIVRNSTVSGGLGGITGMAIDSVGNIFFTTYQNGSNTSAGFQITSESSLPVSNANVATVFRNSVSGATWEVYLEGWILDQGSQSTASTVIGYVHGGYGGIIKVSGTAPSSLATAVSRPTNSVVPSISGNAVFGQTLTTSNGTWANAPTSYTYQWSSASSSSGSYTNISGATSSSYTLTSSDTNQFLKVTVTATNSGGSNSATSSASSQIGKANQSITLLTLGTSTKSYPYSQALSMSTTGSSGTGAKTYSIASGGTASGCGLSNSTSTATISATSSGTCLVVVSIAADSNYNSATSSSLTFTFNKSAVSEITLPTAVLDPNTSLVFNRGSTLRVNTSGPGKVEFRANGKVIPGCKSRPVGVGNEATCSYKPVMRGQVSISAHFTSTSASGTPCSSGGVCTLGQTGPGGGVIFYISGSTYFEAAPKTWYSTINYSGAPYGNGAIPFCGDSSNSSISPNSPPSNTNTNTSWGDGAANTAAFKPYCPGGAFALLTAYRGGGKTDWYIPNATEIDGLHSYWSSGGRSLTTQFHSDRPIYYWTSNALYTSSAWLVISAGFSSDSIWGANGGAFGSQGGHTILPIRKFEARAAAQVVASATYQVSRRG